MMQFDGRPLIGNNTPPDELFDQQDLDCIIKAMKRKIAQEKGHKVKEVEPAEKVKVGRLLNLARFNGYYPRRFDEKGNIRWSCLAECQYPKMALTETRIRVCNACKRSFYGTRHKWTKLPKTEMPFLCWRCEKRKNEKNGVRHHERHKGLPEFLRVL